MQKVFLILVFFLVGNGFAVSMAAPVQQEEQQIKNIQVEGTKRLDTSTVLSYLPLKKGQRVTSGLLDQALKSLYKTNLFSDVSVTMQDGGLLVVRVQENPSVNQVFFEGNSLLKASDLKKAIKVQPFQPYTRSRVQQDALLIQRIYESQGNQMVHVKPQVVLLKNNRVNVIYKIFEGEGTQVLKISFIGNKHFSKSALKDVIKTKESRFYRFFSSSDIYNPSSVALDERQLEVFYQDNGFWDFQISPTVVQQAPAYNGYYITYIFSEGTPYTIGKMSFSIDQSFFKPIKEKPLREEMEDTFSVGDVANRTKITKLAKQLSFLLQDAGFTFVKVSPQMTKNPKTHTVDFVMRVEPSRPVYVEKINIHGNVRTSDQFIRSKLSLKEGSPFNRLFYNKSKESLMRTDFFKSVNLKEAQGSAADQKIIDITLEEKGTGNFNFGFTLSSLWGLGFKFSYGEKNFLGLGKQLSVSLSKGESNQSYELDYFSPGFWNSLIDGGFVVSYSDSKRTKFQNYDYNDVTVSPYISFALGEYLRQDFGLSYSQENISNVRAAVRNSILLEEMGRKAVQSIYQELRYDSTDSSFLPTQGYRGAIFVKYAGFGGAAHFVTGSLSASAYKAYDEQKQFTFFAKGSVGRVMPMGLENVLPSYRLKLGYDNLKAFSYGGLGPYDPKAGTFLGGRKKVYGSVGVLSPLFLPRDYNLRFTLFYELGTIHEIGKRGRPGVLDDKFYRSDIGMGVSWISPIGLVSFHIARPLQKRPYDSINHSQFEIGGGF